MDHATRMRVGHRVADLHEHPDQPRQARLRVAIRDRLETGRHPPAKSLEDLVESLAPDPLHGQERSAVARRDAELVDRHDVRMFELAGHLALEDESDEGVAILGVEEALHRHLPQDLPVRGEPDLSHPTATEDRDGIVLRAFSLIAPRPAPQHDTRLVAEEVADRSCPSKGRLHGVDLRGRQDAPPDERLDECSVPAGALDRLDPEIDLAESIGWDQAELVGSRQEPPCSGCHAPSGRNEG